MDIGLNPTLQNQMDFIFTYSGVSHILRSDETVLT